MSSRESGNIRESWKSGIKPVMHVIFYHFLSEIFYMIFKNDRVN